LHGENRDCMLGSASYPLAPGDGGLAGPVCRSLGRRQPASEPAAATSAAAAASSFREVPPAPRPLAWVRVPKIAGHLGARDIGLVINTADPYSVEVGAFYAAARHLAPEQILRVDCPSRRC
jgi:hypothetical protein